MCSGIGVCHRAAALLNACNASVALRGVFACDVGRSPRKVLSADFPGLRVFGDVAADGARLPPCDVLVAGFPCQPFSAANRRRKGSADERCQVIEHILRYIERAAPKLVLLENVVGLLSYGRDVFLALTRRLQAAGYSIALQTLRSDVHGGVPQCRRRLFIMALLSPSAAVAWPAPIAPCTLPSILSAAAGPPVRQGRGPPPQKRPLRSTQSSEVWRAAGSQRRRPPTWL